MVFWCQLIFIVNTQHVYGIAVKNIDNVVGAYDIEGRLTHWGREKMTAISQTTLWNACSGMKILEFPLKFH